MYKYRILFFGIVVVFLTSSCASTSNISRKNQADMVVAKSRSYIGIPYKYGGTSVLGMDCSGLLMRSFETIDVYIPRTAKDQSKIGKFIGRDELRPGDLVFFAKSKNSRKVTHAGMVTMVKDRNHITFIHSSSSKGVMESNLMSDYWKKMYVKARRVKF